MGSTVLMARQSRVRVDGARLQGWAMVAILAVGFGLGVATLAKPGPQRRLAETMSLGAFLGGQTAGAVNHAMAHDLPIGDLLSEAGGILRWRVFASGGPQVTVGCNDWLYLTEELRPWPSGTPASTRLRPVTLRPSMVTSSGPLPESARAPRSTQASSCVLSQRAPETAWDRSAACSIRRRSGRSFSSAASDRAMARSRSGLP